MEEIEDKKVEVTVVVVKAMAAHDAEYNADNGRAACMRGCYCSGRTLSSLALSSRRPESLRI